MVSPLFAGSPLGRLVLFMMCLAIAGSAVGAAHYYLADLPQQELVQAPENGMTGHECIIYQTCISMCQGDPGCLGRCEQYNQGCTDGD
jgi:hypothetical protein